MATCGATEEFQAVILATISDGDSLYPLTDTLPLALLPVANRPLISYQLELLAKSHSFKQVLVVTTDRWLSQLSTWVSESYKGPLQVELLVVPEGSGSADALRHEPVRSKLVTDFVLLAGDVITDVPFQQMADQHRLQSSAAVTALFRESVPREAGVAKKARDLDGIDFVGVDEEGQRLLSLEAAADCDGGVVSVSQSLLRAYPHVTLRTDLVDAHVYFFAHWVLDVLNFKEHFSSAKFELLPYLVRKQFLAKANLKGLHRRTPASDGAAQPGSPGSPGRGIPSGGGRNMPPMPLRQSSLASTEQDDGSQDPSALRMSAGKLARHQLNVETEFRCSCYILPHDASYCVRASTIKEYMQANVDVSRESRVTAYEKAEGSDGTAAKEGNFVHKSRDKDSTLGEGVEVRVCTRHVHRPRACTTCLSWMLSTHTHARYRVQPNTACH